jgi:RimJ/RimL family protein N-acetyltransferase
MIPRDLRLRTARLELRPTEPADAPRLSEIQSDWNVTRMLRLAPWPPDPAAMAQWVAGHPNEWREGTAYRFAVILDGRLVGQTDVDDINGPDGEIGYWFEASAWGTGIATEAAGALVRFALQELGLTRLRAGHAGDNPASGKVLEKLGFREVETAMRMSRPHGRPTPYRFLELRAPVSLAM